MGCCATKTTVSGAAGNLLVEGFLRYTQASVGWTREKSGRREVFVEVYKADMPLGTFRGHVFLLDVTMEDVISYVKYKLGSDTYELLEQDEESSVFREFFDFRVYNEEGMKAIAGDHRGETAERMEASMGLHNPRQKGLSQVEDEDDQGLFGGGGGSARKHGTTLVTVRENSRGDDADSKDATSPDTPQSKTEDEDPEELAAAITADSGGDGESRQAESVRAQDGGSLGDSEERTGASVAVASSTRGEDGGSSSDEDDEEDEPRPILVDAAAGGSMRNTLVEKDKSWHSRLMFMSSNSMKRGASSRTKGRGGDEREFPARREMVFRRQDYGLGQNRAVVIAQSMKYNKKALAKRCTIHMMGVLVEESMERKRPRVKLTYVCSVDPELAKWEEPLATAEALSYFGGKMRCVNFLSSTLDFFSKPNNRLLQQFRQTASAVVGEMGWEEVERSKNELQLGTNVQHPTYGHGVVQSFDMKGRVRVVYDNKQVVDHDAASKDELRVAVIIGTRVSHPERGLGTVKAFDEVGRIHVKFDNGELHRYKQDAWKKKMHSVKMLGIGGALGSVKLSWRPVESVREGMGRVKFAVGVSCEDVLEYLLAANADATEDDKKAGMLIERRVVQVISDNERVIYEHRKMPPPLTPRDFVFKEVWSALAPNTFAIVSESIRREDLPEKQGVVRGAMHLSGWLLEPLYLDEESYDGDDHVCRLTYQMCMDAKGFVPPDSVEAVRQAQLLGALTDVRAYFWAQSQLKSKQKMMLRNRPSKRMSDLGQSNSGVLIGGGASGGGSTQPGMPRAPSKLRMTAMQQ